MNAMPHILLTRPNPALVEAARAVLPDVHVHDLAYESPELVADEAWCFVDWLLEDMSGLEVCRRLRAAPATSASHITMVLDSEDAASRSRALVAGADDYMLGPLTAESFTKRLRLYTGNRPALNKAASGLTLDAEAQQVRWQGRLIPLRPREISLLQLFLDQPDRLLSRSKIIALLGKESDVLDERTVDVWVGRLRRTLETHGLNGVLRTVRSMGYVFDTPQL